MAARLAVLSYCLVVPGRALVRWLGVQTASRIDALLIVITLSLSSVSAAVTLLLVAHLYYRPVLVVLLLCPAAFLVLSRHDRPRDSAMAAAPRIQRDNVELAILAAVALFLCVYLLDALTTPTGGWDGLVTWGKWTADWGRRNASGDYTVGGYPQLVPRFLSVLYKIDGTSQQVLPLDAFVIHAFGVAAAAWLVLASARLARLLDLPSWPLVLLSFGSLKFREQIGTGSVDVLLAAATVTLLALFLALRNGEWQARRGAWAVVGAAMFACIFTKVTGAFALAAVASLAIAGARRERARDERRQLLLGLAVALVAIAPFVVEQGLAESGARHGQLRPEEVNIPAGGMARVLAADSDQAYHGEPLAMRPKTAVLRFWNNYDVPDTLRWPMSALLLILFAAGAIRRDLRGLAVVVSLYAAIWLVWSSYDQRNLFLALPLIGAIAAAGTARLASRSGPLLLSLLAVLLGTFVVLSGGGLLKDAQARLKAMVGGPAAVLTRLGMMPQGPPDRPAFFFPRYAEVYRYVSTLARRTGAQHVFSTSPLFRFYANGVFTLFDWPDGLSHAGDVFAGHDGHRPDDAEAWVLVAAPGWHRVWLREQLQDMPIPSPEATSQPGAAGATDLMIETGPFDFDNGVVAWQVTMAGVPPALQVVAVFDTSDPQSIDAELSSTTVEADPTQLWTRYSGVVVLKPGLYRPSGTIRVGIRASGPPGQIVAFKLSRRPGDGHRPRVE